MLRSCFLLSDQWSKSLLLPISLGILCFGSQHLSVNAQIIEQNNLIVQDSEQNAEENLEEKAIALLNELKAENFAGVRQMFAPDLAQPLSEEDIATIWNRIIEKTGQIQTYSDIRVINTLDADLVIVKTEFANLTNNVLISYNKQGEVIGVNVPALDSIEDISRNFITFLSQKNYNAARGLLHPFMKTELFAPQIQEKWEFLIQKNGELKSIENVETVSGISGSSEQVVQVTVDFEGGSEDIFLIFDPNSLITGVDIVTQ